jgi:colanic acid/amylovoran biosynthesis glycosyltransferase
MKILICTATFDIVDNGAVHFPNFLLRINELYPQHEVSVLTEDITHLPNKSYANVYPVTVSYPRPVHALQTFLRNVTYWKAIKALHKIKNFDIIVFNSGILGVWTRMQLPKQILIFGFIHDYNGLVVQRSHHQTWLKYIYKHLEHKLLTEKMIDQTSMTILCCSNYLKDLVKNKYPHKVDSIISLQQAIEISKIQYQTPKAFTNILKIIFVKANYRIGGLFELGQALWQLNPLQFELTVMGPSEHEFSKIHTFFDKISNIKLNLHSITPQSIVFQALTQHDIFCIPSKAEALGLANAEALASGISVVSTSAGGIPEIMNAGNNGWLAKPNDINSLEQALRNCIEAPLEERIKKSRNGRSWVEQNFDYTIMLKKFISLIE